MIFFFINVIILIINNFMVLIRKGPMMQYKHIYGPRPVSFWRAQFLHNARGITSATVENPEIQILGANGHLSSSHFSSPSKTSNKNPQKFLQQRNSRFFKKSINQFNSSRRNGSISQGFSLPIIKFPQIFWYVFFLVLIISFMG